jgi:hypothetical protein
MSSRLALRTLESISNERMTLVVPDIVNSHTEQNNCWNETLVLEPL